LADTGGGRLATEHGKHAPCGVFFVFGRWERAGETGEGVGGYGRGQASHRTRKTRPMRRVLRVWQVGEGR